MKLNAVLYRQLERSYGSEFAWENLPPNLQHLLEQVNTSYENNKLEKKRTERVFRIVDEEFKELLTTLKSELKEKDEGFDKLRKIMTRLDSGDREFDDYHELIDSIKASIDRKLQLQKNLEESLKMIEQQSRQQSEFLSFMSHEVRTPLHAISGLVQMMNAQDHPTAQDPYIVKLREIVFRTIDLVNSVLEMQKMDAGASELSLEPVHLFGHLNDVVDGFDQYLKENNNSLVLDYRADKNIRLQLDKFKITQVCSNLISNAMKFTQNGEVKLIVDAQKEGIYDRVRIRVEDNGIGMNEEELDTIFRMFSSSTPDLSGNQQGSGLGLYFCNKLLESLDSSLQVESTKNEGSSFYFDFKTKESKAQSIEKEIKKSRNILKGKHILIADDYELNIKIINGLLTKEGASTVCVKNGKEVLEKMENDQFDLVILDINMPVLDGLSTAQIIMEKYLVPVLPVTASISEEKRKELKALGINEPLFKPFKFDKFIYEIENLLQTA